MATSKQSYQDRPPENNPNPNPNPDPNPSVEEEADISDHESEYSLSLCNLPIHTTTHDESFNSKEIQHQISSNSLLSFSEDNENFFEFFSEEWNITTTGTFPPDDENIIFCGKKIPSKQPLNIPLRSQEKSSINSLKCDPKRDSSATKSGDKVMVPKVSVFTSPVKPKWLLVLFGLLPRIPTDEMELMTDIRNRQSRHGPSTFFPSDRRGGGDQEMVVVRRRGREKGLWRFIKATSCFGG